MGIRLEAIRKSFADQTQALKDIAIEVESGKFLVLVGPSGCGKSTLLRIIAGLEDPSSGAVYIDGKDVTAVEPKNRNVAMVFQNYALYPHMTVTQNLEYPLKIARMPKGKRQETIARTAEFLQLGAVLQKRPGELSGGQKQRVAIGRALVREPSVFLFDEPLSNLDARLREELRLEIGDLHSRLRRTTVYVTHDQHEAMTLAEMLVVMRNGAIEQIGSPLALYRNPDTFFVAHFLGSPPINVLRGTLDAGGTFNTPEGLSLSIFAQNTPPHLLNKSLILALRPEHLHLATDTGARQPTFAAKVERIEHLGAESIYALKAIGPQNGGATLIMKARHTDLQAGKTATFCFTPDSLLWFDQSSEQRLQVEQET